MGTNRDQTMPLNRRHVNDKEAASRQGSLDDFLREPFADLSNSPLVFGPVRVHNNVFTSIFRIFRVMAGTTVVVTGDGRVLEVLQEGSYHALSFPVMNRIDLYVVNTRERTLDITTTKEFTIFYQPPQGEKIALPVDLDVAVSYQIIHPEHVALVVEQPLTRLYDTVMESIRSITASIAKYQDFQAGGHAGYMVAQQLQQRGIEDNLGIRVSNVQITRIAGAEELDKKLRDVYMRTREAQTDAEVAKIQANSQAEIAMAQALTQMNISRMIELTPQYLLLTNPDMYTRVFGDKAQTDGQRLLALTEMAKAGMLPMGTSAAGSNDLQQVLLGALTGQAVAPPTATLGGMYGVTVPALPSPVARFSGAGAGERLRNEIGAMLAQGLNAALHEDANVFLVSVSLRDQLGHTLGIYFSCTARYPQEAPTMFVEFDGQEQRFMPEPLANWTPQCDLLVLVEAVMTAYA
ncbi:SPFH domain-containing protein [Candidatus Chloroploca sp. Khr17]|uniref:SPFH domain-containing protein n=1 Tax=Candidatus Chloroploca sp. Khr17 TaxID=2496869 RepID=UPI00101C8C0C|nr:SPFH domain-containing protein [Candidatus Chloroploca sp. Khr17]